MAEQHSLALIVMAAGKGTRLKSKTPKVLQPLMGKTLLQRVLETAAKLEIANSLVIVGYQSEAVKTHLNSIKGLPFKVQPVLQEPQLGTGHAVMQVKAQLTKPLDGDVLILSGDVPLLTEETLQALVTQHQQSGSHLTLLTANLEQPTGYGRILLDSDSHLTGIVEEKDATEAQKTIQQINAGVYCINWQAVSPLLDKLSSNNAQGEFYLTDLISLGLKQNLKLGWASVSNPREITGVNTRQDLAHVHQALNQRVLKKLMTNGVTIIDPQQTWIAPEVTIGSDTTIYPGCLMEGNITIGEDCVIGPNTKLQGTVTVGNNTTLEQSQIMDSTVGNQCVIGPFAHLRNQAVISNQVRIGNFVEVKNSTIDSHTNASHLAYIGDATLGSDVNIGAGTITANYNPITDTKHQTILKDGVKVGSNAVFVAPVTVNKNATIAAGSVITQDVSENALAITRPQQAEVAEWVTKKKAALSKGSTAKQSTAKPPAKTEQTLNPIQ